MKISSDTLQVLKNFATINESIVVEKGKVLKTIAVSKIMQSVAKVKENFPKQFGIYDLPELLGAISLFENPDFTFGEKAVIISEGKSKIQYFYGSQAGIIAPEKEVKFPAKFEISAEISKEQIDQLMKAASVLNVEYIALTSDGKSVLLSVFNKSNDNSTGNSYSIRIAKGDGSKFRQIWAAEHLKIIPENYDLRIKANRISEFKSTDSDLTYWIALDTDSSYDEK